MKIHTETYEEWLVGNEKLVDEDDMHESHDIVEERVADEGSYCECCGEPATHSVRYEDIASWSHFCSDCDPEWGS